LGGPVDRVVVTKVSAGCLSVANAALREGVTKCLDPDLRSWRRSRVALGLAMRVRNVSFGAN
jgi:hypothetical protein